MEIGETKENERIEKHEKCTNNNIYTSIYTCEMVATIPAISIKSAN